MAGRGWGSAGTRHMLVAAALVVTSLLSACASGQASAGKSTATIFPFATLSPTLTPAPTATPVADPMSVCTNTSGSRVSIMWTYVGALDGGWQALPSTLALKPQPGALSMDNQQNATLALKGVTLSLGLNDSIGGPGYVCAVTVKIVGYHPLAAPIPNVTRTCSDLPWANPGGVEGGSDCGAIGFVNGRADMAFASTAAGVSASSAFHDVNYLQSTEPVVVPASGNQEAASVWAHVTVPASGTYILSVGIWQDRSGPAVFTTLQAT
ncbi:MAG TPA: hypothetical protein VF818_06535, partial [Ktedonobacterales bacterium]